MKKYIASLILVQCFVIYLVAQNTTTAPTDKSPMDMSYFPNNYPVLKINDKVTEPLAARVVYSRPQKAGRTIFGGLVKFGEVWRMGANEATEIEFFKPVKIGDKKIAKGRYTLYGIVSEDSWTIIINKDTDTWGAFRYDAKKDIARILVPVQKTDTITESLSMIFEKSAKGFNLVITWDNSKAILPVVF